MEPAYSNKDQIQSRSALWPAISLQIVLCTLLFGTVLWINKGEWYFPLDDSYIHLGLAKNLLQYGYPGISGRFEFASSSPGYLLFITPILAVFGKSLTVVIPLLMAILSVFLLRSTYLLLNYQGLPRQWIAISLLAMVVLAPLPLLALNGMEHLLQVWIDLAFVGLLVNHLSKPGNHSNQVGLLILAAGVTLFRYEGLFLVGIGAVLAAWDRRWAFALKILIAGVLAPLGLGLYSLAMGGPFLPQSVLLKGVPGLMAQLRLAVEQLYEKPFSLIILGSGALAWALQPSNSNGRKARLWLSMAILPFLAQVLLSRIGGYRYEAWAVALWIVAMALSLYQLPKRFWPSRKRDRLMAGAGIALWLYPLVMRTAFFTMLFPGHTQTLHGQQVSMARFIQDYYPQARVAVNDLGAVCFFTEANLTDLAGIGDWELAKELRSGGYKTDDFAALVARRNLDIIAVHDVFLEGRVPGNWYKVATWYLPDRPASRFRALSWYVTNPYHVEKFAGQLLEFRQKLPPWVQVEIFH